VELADAFTYTVQVVQLIRRRFGSAGLLVTRIGLGLAALGRPGYITLGRSADLGDDRSVALMEERCHRMLDVAYAAGLRYVDAARSYGLAEAFLASWLKKRNLSGSALTIGSKWGYAYTGGWRVDAPKHEVKDLSVGALRRQIQETRAQLGPELGLYQIHSATIESGVLADQDVLEELLGLRSEGLAIGLTVTGPRQADTIRKALNAHVGGINPFQSVQATWNLLETSAEPALAEAHAQGWGVIIKEALANGRLTDRDPGEWIRPLKRQAEALETSTDAFAFAAALSRPWADVVLSGAVTPDQLHSNLRALAMTDKAVRWPDIAEAPDKYWAHRGTLAWA
jgi:aryl-alcohol dehydrogenase-like predicted oxidoreductase